MLRARTLALTRLPRRVWRESAGEREKARGRVQGEREGGRGCVMGGFEGPMNEKSRIIGPGLF